MNLQYTSVHEIYDGDEYATLSSGDVICLYCYDNGYYGKDVITGKEYADNHLNSVVLKSDEEDYLPIWTRFTSAYPYSIYGYEEAWDKYFKIEQFHSNADWQSNYYVTKEDCTEEGLKLFRKEED